MRYVFTNSANQATFRLDYLSDVLTSGANFAYGEGRIEFTLFEPVSYLMTGHFAGSSSDSTNGFNWRNGIGKLPTATEAGFTVGIEEELRNQVSSASFDLDGISQADPFNFDSFRISGTLTPGSYSYQAFGEAFDFGHSGSASAGGFSQLTLTSTISATAPEPASLTIWSLSALALGVFSRHRRKMDRSLPVRLRRP